mmetsp:Transcript_52085/g.52453  ORF Transcript_52085/g.52453 Transcript_52085/m.52453 type:complete len:276 (-) Transcript_52085:545-1372(-)
MAVYTHTPLTIQITDAHESSHALDSNKRLNVHGGIANVSIMVQEQSLADLTLLEKGLVLTLNDGLTHLGGNVNTMMRAIATTHQFLSTSLTDQRNISYSAPSAIGDCWMEYVWHNIEVPMDTYMVHKRNEEEINGNINSITSKSIDDVLRERVVRAVLLLNCHLRNSPAFAVRSCYSYNTSDGDKINNQCTIGGITHYDLSITCAIIEAIRLGLFTFPDETNGEDNDHCCDQSTIGGAHRNISMNCIDVEHVQRWYNNIVSKEWFMEAYDIWRSI